MSSPIMLHCRSDYSRPMGIKLGLSIRHVFDLPLDSALLGPKLVWICPVPEKRQELRLGLAPRLPLVNPPLRCRPFLRLLRRCRSMLRRRVERLLQRALEALGHAGLVNDLDRLSG